MMADELEAGITSRLVIEPATASELAVELGVSPAKVRRRLRKLAECGAIEYEGKTRRRGVSESLYSMRLSRGILGPGERRGLPTPLCDEAVARLLRRMFHEAIASVESGTFHAREEFALLRFPLPLDVRGFDEARVLHETLVRSIIVASEGARARSDRGQETFPVYATVLFLEAPRLLDPPSPSDLRCSSNRWSRRGRLDSWNALGDPFRIKLLDTLSIGPAGAADLAERTGASIERVRYEMKRLRNEGAIGIHSRRQRRGAHENVYLLEPQNGLVSADEAAGLDGDGGSTFCRMAVAQVFRDTVAAVHAGVLRDREDHVVVRMPMRIDAQGFGEISAAMDSTLRRLFELRERCLARTGEHEIEPRPALSGLLLFESSSR